MCCKTWKLVNMFCFKVQNGSWHGEQWINFLFYLPSFHNYFCKYIECQAAVGNMLCLQCLSERRMTLNLKILQEEKKCKQKFGAISTFCCIFVQVCILVYLYQLTEATFQKKKKEREKVEKKLKGDEAKEEVSGKGRKEQKSFLTSGFTFTRITSLSLQPNL